MTVNDVVGQSDPPPDDEAGQTDPTTGEATENPAGEDQADDDHQEDDQDDANTTGAERKQRRRAQKAESERDAALKLLTETRGFILSNAVASAGYTPKVAELLAADMDALLDDKGLPDAEKIMNAIITTTTEWDIARKPRPPRENPQQGTATVAPHGESSWSSALKGP